MTEAITPVAEASVAAAPKAKASATVASVEPANALVGVKASLTSLLKMTQAHMQAAQLQLATQLATLVCILFASHM